MASRVQQEERLGDVGTGLPTRHLYEGSTANPSTVGDLALCGHRATEGSMSGRVWSRKAVREHCVVCLDLAAAKGYV